MKFIITGVFTMILFSNGPAWSHGGGEEVSASVGPGMAVTEADPAKGFRLSEAAWKRLGIETQPVQNVSAPKVPKESWVHFREEYGIYRYRDGWFKLIEGERKESGGQTTLKPKDGAQFQEGDHVAVKGMPLLRVTELDLFGSHEEEEEKHGEHKEHTEHEEEGPHHD